MCIPMYEDILCSGKIREDLMSSLNSCFLLNMHKRAKYKAICYLLKESKTTDITKFLSIEAAQYEGKFMHSLGAR